MGYEYFYKNFAKWLLLSMLISIESLLQILILDNFFFYFFYQCSPYYKEHWTDKLIELSFVSITHFSAVMHQQKPETLVEMDVSMAKFANVNVDSVRYFQTTDLLTFIEWVISLTTSGVCIEILERIRNWWRCHKTGFLCTYWWSNISPGSEMTSSNMQNQPVSKS